MTCKQCGRTFVPESDSREFCSIKCDGLWRYYHPNGARVPASDVLAITSLLMSQCRAKRIWVLANKPTSKQRTQYVENIRQERLAYERVHSRLRCLLGGGRPPSV